MSLPEPKRHSKYDHIARTYAHNTDWEPFPGQSKLTKGTRRVYRSRINAGEILPGFQAAIRNNTLYIRPRKESDQ